MEKFLKLSAVVLVILFVSGSDASLPSIITKCERNSPNLEECISSSMDELRPYLASGDFGENFTIPKIEPLYIEAVKMQRGPDFQVALNKLNIYGCSKFHIDKLRANAKNLTFDFNIKLAKVNFTSKYSLKMKMLLLNLVGKGDMRGSLSNVRITFKVRGFLEKINGTEFVRMQRIQVKLKIEDGKFQLDNLFNGDPTLGRIGNQVINDNSRIFLDELIPGLEKSLSKTFTEIVNNILKSATYDDMFPEKS